MVKTRTSLLDDPTDSDDNLFDNERNVSPKLALKRRGRLIKAVLIFFLFEFIFKKLNFR